MWSCHIPRHLTSAYLAHDLSHWLVFDLRVPNYVGTKVRSDPTVPRHELRAHRVDGTITKTMGGPGGQGEVRFQTQGASLQVDVAYCGWTSSSYGLHIGSRRVTKALCAKCGGLLRPEPIQSQWCERAAAPMATTTLLHSPSLLPRPFVMMFELAAADQPKDRTLYIFHEDTPKSVMEVRGAVDL